VEVTALGHAGLRISGATTTGLVDPWFATSGAFLGAWHQFPENSHLAARALEPPNWVALSSADDDRCDLDVLARLPPATPTFVPAGRTSLTRRLRASTRLLVVEVPPLLPVKLDERGSRLAFVPSSDPGTEPNALAVIVDGVSLFVWTRDSLGPDHLEWVRSMGGGRVDVIAVQIAVPSNAPLHATIDAACAGAVATDAAVVVPHGGPPCFLDPELAPRNQELTRGSLPTGRRLAEILGARLPGRHVTSLLPGDRLFPRDGVVVEDPTWADFAEVGIARYLRDYAHRRAVELSYVHSRFLPPEQPLGPALATHVRSLADGVSGPPGRLRVEVTGPGGGTWDLAVDEAGVVVEEVSGPASSPEARIRVASRWLAAVIDGRATWRQLLRSFRCSVAGTGRDDPDQLLPRLVRADQRVPIPLARSVVTRPHLLA
jgi:UDP-MurNAc hydroxylase